MKTTLTIRSSYDDKLIMQLSQENEALTIDFAEGDMVTAAERWKERGIIEWIDINTGTWPTIEAQRTGAYDTRQRVTPSTHPEFLPRLKIYLEKQFSFHINITV